MTDTINLDTATRSELVEYAVDTLGLTLDSKANKETIRNAINDVLGDGAPTIQEAEGEPVTTKIIISSSEEETNSTGDVPPAKGARLAEEERTTIIIAASDKDKLPVVVGVNGRNYVIQRGKEADVPTSVVEVLKNAKQTIFDAESLETHEALAYPFQVVR